ncbi:phage virion morphogenesis protein [uncultured Cohaesibacter sp.]|uniref:phage virion morphogenesis protein n=1 Tax=uncultured Cohaesibacter sp. TaxID=1002546 RepID=UPI0029C85BCF|nr:phage virion morphogenesis protein [uncultured Cohaesibacter sp.]
MPFLSFRYDYASADQEIRRLIDKIEDKAAIHRVIGMALYNQTMERFEREESPDGNKWAPLTPLTLSNRRQSRGILRDSGELMRSIHFEASSSRAEVGTNLNHPKVWVMQHGATIKPRRFNSLRIPVAGGAEGFVFSKGVKIPARPYIGIGRQDEEAIREELEGYLGE